MVEQRNYQKNSNASLRFSARSSFRILDQRLDSVQNREFRYNEKIVDETRVQKVVNAAAARTR